MRGLRGWLAVVALAIVGVTAQAQEKTSFLGESEFATAPGFWGCSADMLSMKENAKVKIGGITKLRYSWVTVGAEKGTFSAPGGGLGGGDPDGIEISLFFVGVSRSSIEF